MPKPGYNYKSSTVGTFLFRKAMLMLLLHWGVTQISFLHRSDLSYGERINSVLFICEYFTWYMFTYAPVVRRNIILDSVCKITGGGQRPGS